MLLPPDLGRYHMEMAGHMRRHYQQQRLISGKSPFRCNVDMALDKPKEHYHAKLRDTSSRTAQTAG